jgi:hypothetical protein
MKVQRYCRKLFLTTVKTMSKQKNCPGKRDEIFSNNKRNHPAYLPYRAVSLSRPAQLPYNQALTVSVRQIQCSNVQTLKYYKQAEQTTYWAIPFNIRTTPPCQASLEFFRVKVFCAWNSSGVKSFELGILQE